jgi:hypothetical protein
VASPPQRNNTVVEKLSAPPNGAAVGPGVRKGGETNEEFDNLAKKLLETQKERDELSKEL